MLNLKKLSKRLWAEALNTTWYTINHVYHHLGNKKTPYELQKGKKPNLGYLYTFGSMYFILNDHEHFGKFNSKNYANIFIGYFDNSRAFRVYNLIT